MDIAKEVTTDPVTHQAAPETPFLVSGPKREPAELRDPWGKVRKLALERLDEIIGYEPKVLKGDSADAVHDIRVATRRLQQALDLLYPAPRPKTIQKLRRRLKRCRRVLSELRNCDVLLENIQQSLNRKQATHRAAREAVQAYVLQLRTEAFKEATRQLGKIKLAGFYVRLKDCLKSNGAAPHLPVSTTSPSDGFSAELFQSRIRQALADNWLGFEEAVAKSRTDGSVQVLHGARIAAKHLRYLLELLGKFEFAGSAEALAWLKRVQQQLGDWHDLQVLEEKMIVMVARPEFLRDSLEQAMAVEKLILLNRNAKERLRRRYLQTVAESSQYHNVRQWVGQL